MSSWFENLFGVVTLEVIEDSARLAEFHADWARFGRKMPAPTPFQTPEALGLGRELLAQALQYAHEQGYRHWDFLRGDEAFKSSWGGQLVARCRVTIRRLKD